MDSELVKVENVSKKYCGDLKKSLIYGVQDVAGEIFRYIDKDVTLRTKEFWAVNDVSFSLKRGECLGLIGKNGAGKSTLLKMLHGLIKPNKGKITIRGRLGALIELGAGFSPVLTGRENIYINGTILGLSKKEIDKKLDAIIDFSEINDFIDMPVQSYSSGMKVRLGFAIAAQMDPDILIIDEVLSVGDIGFRRKCYNYISNILKDTVVIIVSHSIPQIARYCTKVILLNEGKMCNYGSASESIEKYYALFDNEYSTVLCEKNCKLNFLNILDDKNNNDFIEYNSGLRIIINATIDIEVKKPNITLAFHDRELRVVAVCKSEEGEIYNSDGTINLSVEISPVLLGPGNYKLSLIIFDERNHKHLIWYNAAWDINIRGNFKHYGGTSIYFNGDWSQM